MHGFGFPPLWIVFLVIISLGLTSCGESETGTSASSGGTNKVAVVKKKPKQAEIKKPEPEIIQEYRYSRIGKRNPFIPLVEVKKNVREARNTTGADIPVEELTPLQKVETQGLRLLGIIIGKGASRAMVDAPDGKSYILKVGTKVGKSNGEVVDIGPATVFVKEKYQDFSGEIHESIIEIGLPEREGER